MLKPSLPWVHYKGCFKITIDISHFLPVLTHFICLQLKKMYKCPFLVIILLQKRICGLTDIVNNTKSFSILSITSHNHNSFDIVAFLDNPVGSSLWYYFVSNKSIGVRYY